MLDLLFSGQDDNFQGNKLLPDIKQHLRANKQHLDLIWVIYSSDLNHGLGTFLYPCLGPYFQRFGYTKNVDSVCTLHVRNNE